MRRRILAALCAAVLGMTVLPRMPVSSEGMEGKDDSGIFYGTEWSYDSESKTVTFSGEGEMLSGNGSYAAPDRPWWEDHLSEAERLVVNEGITGLGRGIFHFGYVCQVQEISLPSTLKTIGGSAFSSLRNVREFIIPEGVTEIGGAAFSGCTDAERIILPDTVTLLNGKEVFGGCWALRELKLPGNLTALPKLCFSQCRVLERVDLPDSIETVGRDCFQECKSLTFSKLPATLKTVERGAFSGCRFTDDLELPPLLDSIGEEAFPDAWVRSKKTVLTPTGYLYSYRNPAEFWIFDETVMDHRFLGINEEYETDVVLPDTVKTIAPYAFSFGSSYYSDLYTNVFDSLTLPASVTDIRENAFAGCEIREIRGYTGSYAQEYAMGNGIPFRALDSEQPAVGPAYGERTISVSNTGAMLGTGYPMNDWHTLLLLERNGNNPLEIKDAETGWKGSCYGLAVLQILLDTGALKPEAFGAASIPEIRPTEQTVSFINCLHHVSDLTMMISRYAEQSKFTQPQRLARMIMLAQEVNAGGMPFLIHFRTDPGMHAVAGYGLESGSWEWYGLHCDRRILLWDSNYTEGSEQAQLYYNSETMFWCIPAYKLKYTDSADDAGALLYAVDRVPETFAYFTARLNPLPGDVNADAALTVSDAVLLNRYLTEDSGGSITALTGQYNLDTNEDGYADLDDLLYILRQLAA